MDWGIGPIVPLGIQRGAGRQSLLTVGAERHITCPSAHRAIGPGKPIIPHNLEYETQLQAAVLACTMERDKLVGSNPTMLVAVPGYLASGGQLDPDFSDLLAGGSLGPSWGVFRTQHLGFPLIANSLLGRATLRE